VEITGAEGTRSITVNQREKGGWVKVASGKFKAGRESSLTLSNKGTNGFVIADGALWAPVK
jgi:hypothetical protein